MRDERRRRDGLGLLPRARTAAEVRRRARANMLGAIVLIVVGAFSVGGSLALLTQHMQVERWISLLLGLALLVQGLLIAGRRERRLSRKRGEVDPPRDAEWESTEWEST